MVPRRLFSSAIGSPVYFVLTQAPLRPQLRGGPQKSR